MSAFRLALTLSATLAVLASVAAYSIAQEPRIDFARDSDGAAVGFAIRGLNQAELAAFARLAEDRQRSVARASVVGAPADAPAVAGEWSIVDASLRFTPRYPPAPGVRYRVTVDRRALGGSAQPLDAELELPKPATKPTTVERIYPTVDRLPENQLKFYLQFSAPMSRGQAYNHVHLLDAAGKEVTHPFLEVGEELWDPTQTRFTLLLDPGRIKRGLKPREDVGPVLIEGRDYTLVVDAAWRDANGNPLSQAARKSFHTLPPREAPIDVDAWTIESPRAGSKDPLVVRFATPMDRALVERCLRLSTAEGGPISGAVEVGERESSWRFTPEVPWRTGDYRLLVDTSLEDLSGNTIRHAFDVDVFGPIQKQIPTETITINVSVR